jgi:hypothetical protein
MYAVLFNVATDWVMRTTIEDSRWSFFSTLEDIDFADDLLLMPPLPHTHTSISKGKQTHGKHVGLCISTKKLETTTLN